MAGVFVAITVISSEVKRSREICLRRAPGQQQSGGLLLGQTHVINGVAVNEVLEYYAVRVRPSARTHQRRFTREGGHNKPRRGGVCAVYVA